MFNFVIIDFCFFTCLRIFRANAIYPLGIFTCNMRVFHVCIINKETERATEQPAMYR